MKKELAAFLYPFTLALTLSAQSLSAEEADGHTPKFSGALTAGILDVDGREAEPWAFKAEAGVGGIYGINDGLRIRYDFVADFANAINSVDEQTWTPGAYSQEPGEVYVRTARVLLLTDYGSIGFQPRVPSGFWKQIYGNIDVFEYNRFHGQTGQNAIFGQNEQAKNVLTYGSPRFGGFQFIAAMINPKQDVDVVTGRIVYSKGPLNLGLGHTQVSRPLIEDLHRTSFGIGYDFGSVKLGGVYEHNQDKEDSSRPADFDAWGVSISADLTEKWSTSIAYASNDKTGDRENDGVVGNVRHHFNSKIYAFVEGAYYEESDNNILGGVSIQF